VLPPLASTRFKTRWTARKTLANLQTTTRRREVFRSKMPPKTKENVSSDDATPKTGALDGPSKKKVKTTANNEPLMQTEIERLYSTNGAGAGSNFKAISWNIAGMRSFYEKNISSLEALIETESPDVLILQEHKLQEGNVADFTAKLKNKFPQYVTVRFAVSTAKKGYSGVVALCKATEKKAAGEKQQVSLDAMLGGAKSPAKSNRYAGPKLLSISEGLGSRGYTDEGRSLTLEYDNFYVVTAYVPNSGQDLKRLDYRIGNWEKDMRAHLAELDAKKPVIYLGDLNVAHLDEDIWNVGAAHIKKSAGTTPQERKAFGVMLEENNLHDAFRFLHKDVKGWFSYWSVRAGNRPYNKGLRLDYTLASKRMFDATSDVSIADSFILDKITGSDHAPVGITLTL